MLLSGHYYCYLTLRYVLKLLTTPFSVHAVHASRRLQSMYVSPHVCIPRIPECLHSTHTRMLAFHAYLNVDTAFYPGGREVVDLNPATRSNFRATSVHRHHPFFLPAPRSPPHLVPQATYSYRASPSTTTTLTPFPPLRPCPHPLPPLARQTQTYSYRATSFQSHHPYCFPLPRSPPFLFPLSSSNLLLEGHSLSPPPSLLPPRPLPPRLKQFTPTGPPPSTAITLTASLPPPSPYPLSSSNLLLEGHSLAPPPSLLPPPPPASQATYSYRTTSFHHHHPYSLPVPALPLPSPLKQLIPTGALPSTTTTFTPFPPLPPLPLPSALRQLTPAGPPPFTVITITSSHQCREDQADDKQHQWHQNTDQNKWTEA